MPATLTYPGVYVEEKASGIRPIAGVSTSTTLFVGASGNGPLDDPELVLSHDEFVEKFGDSPTISDLSRQVKLFFLNGGRTAYVMRIANGATSASVTIADTANNPILDITAASPGLAGEQIRVRVDYDTAAPDSTFNLEVFEWVVDAGGARTATAPETFAGLTMDPLSSRYAPTVLTQTSRHIDAVESGGAPAAGDGSNRSGLAVPHDVSVPTTFRNEWQLLFGLAGPDPLNASLQTLILEVDGGDPVPVVLSGIDVAAIDATSIANSRNALATEIADAITAAHTVVGRPGVVVAVSFEDGPGITVRDDALHGGADYDDTSFLVLTSTTGGDIVVRPDSGPLAQTLRLGGANGGREIGAHAARRPAANAAVLDDADLDTVGALAQSDLSSLTLDGENVPIQLGSVPANPIFVPEAGGYVDGRGGLDGITERLRAIRDAINTHAAGTAGWDWAAGVWGHRLAIWRTAGDDNALLAGDFATAPNDIAASFSDNARLATVGVSGGNAGHQVNPAAVADDGAVPVAADYDAAYTIAESELDIFILLVLPETVGGVDRKALWGPASVFCQRNRAFLIIDPPPTWTGHTEPLDGTGANDSLTDLKIGLVKDHAAIYYPDLVITEDGLRLTTSPGGAMAGLYARTDENRGVWKAPAGTEADLRGISGADRAFSDMENGNLNPRGVNTIRRFPTGIVSWGARTMDGDNDTGSEYKYVPIRRLLLFLEESLYRGLQWTVFEPNGTDLWAAIRVNVGNFLEGLRRQGAFAGTSASESYYVRCDATTTSVTDRNLGIVNVHIGVATLKPAEFIVLSFSQITLPEQ